MIKKIITFAILFFIFYLINQALNSEYFSSHCNSDVMCNGNKINALCINQSCKPCGLQAQCTKNEDCAPNLCIKGCCDDA